MGGCNAQYREVPVQRAVKVQTGVGGSCLVALAPIRRVHTPGWPSCGIFESYFSCKKKKVWPRRYRHEMCRADRWSASFPVPRLAHRREVRLTSVRRSPPRTVGLKQLCDFAAGEKGFRPGKDQKPTAFTAIAAETSSTRLKGAVSAPVIDRPARKSRETELLVVSRPR